MREGYKKTELGEIAVDWGCANTEEILKDEKGSLKIGPFGSQLKKSFLVEKGYKVYGQENVFNNDFNIGNRYIDKERFNKLSSCKLKSGDLVISMMGTVGKTAIVPFNIEEGIMDSHLIRLRVNEDIYDKNLLAQLIRNSELVKKQIRKLSVGGIMEGLSSTIIKQLKFPIPPLHEQQKIADILSTVDIQIDQTDKLIEKTKDLKKGLMQKLLTKGIGHTEFKKTEVGEIPVEWEVRLLGNICNLIDGDRSSNYPSPNEIVDKGILFLSTSNIKDNKLIYNECKFITEQKFNSLRKGKLEKEDLIITLRGTIGSVAKFNSDKYQTGFINAQMLIIRSLEIFPNYLCKYLISDISKKQIEIISSGSAQPQLTKKDLSNLKIAVPSNKEQKQIANILSSVDEKVQQYETKKEKLQELKKGLMQQLLTGKKRVKV
ncbi:restriction endonuclease subunit S [Clostridium sp. ZS2-4]|uniref:restriction endonuclease subunit S n=1 Tax=Clostridium sp. ZS2-4 TaxID=2987703 RepID=UPI00227A1330|nr:restriction endonuclease subunit S [Clostridium sp. ZS2-4]MCY6355375.1 restriction endonuclease subunit S [Clostridium sp. ZS2-4]